MLFYRHICLVQEQHVRNVSIPVGLPEIHTAFSTNFTVRHGSELALYLLPGVDALLFQVMPYGALAHFQHSGHRSNEEMGLRLRQEPHHPGRHVCCHLRACPLLLLELLLHYPRLEIPSNTKQGSPTGLSFKDWNNFRYFFTRRQLGHDERTELLAYHGSARERNVNKQKVNDSVR